MSGIKAIGITGTARSGKDSFFNLLKERYVSFKRYAFADNLKRDLGPFISKHFGFNIFSCSPEQKELVRNILISYGCAQRKVDINYWVKSVAADIIMDTSSPYYQGYISVITDFRFESEVKYFKDKYGDAFKLVEVIRLDSKDTPPQEEILEMPKVRPYVDYKIEWNTVGDKDLNKLIPYVEKFYDSCVK